MGRIEVLHPGIYSSIQDDGRFEFTQYGVPYSGAMDSYSHSVGNILLKNSVKCASIEVTFGKASFLFHSDTIICLTGADFSPQINNVPIEMQTAYDIKQGNILSFGKWKYGVRTYIAVQGGIQSEVILKSKSYFDVITKQAKLHKGDILSIKEVKPYANRGFSKIKRNDFLFDLQELKCYKGPEYDHLTERQKERLQGSFTLSKDLNRVGYRLEEKIENSLDTMITSPVMPGTVQLTPSGTLIVLTKDCQVTGGYPRILQLDDFAISQLSQKTPGKKIQFRLSKL